MAEVAHEEDFIGLVVAHARVEKWVSYIKESTTMSRRRQAMHELATAIETSPLVAEEASHLNLPSYLTHQLGRTSDEESLDAISRLLAALSGAGAHKPRMHEIVYPVVGRVAVKEGMLGDGVGSRIWKISHRFNLLLCEHAELVAGERVLELGSGVGTSGITAAKLGAEEVVLTDFVGEVLHTLSENMVANSTMKNFDAATGEDYSASDAGDEDDDDFEGAESVGELDFDDFLGLGDSNPGASGPVTWAADNMTIKFLDWTDDYDRLQVLHADRSGVGDQEREEDALGDDTSSVFATKSAPENQSGHNTYGTIDVRTHLQDMPPNLAEDEQFPVVLACEVLYELLHARWVAAVLEARLQHCGKALVCGAVRDTTVFTAFEGYLKQRGLCFVKVSVSAATGYPGLGSHEDVYEDGYGLYYVQHKDHPCTTWHAELQDAEFI